MSKKKMFLFDLIHSLSGTEKGYFKKYMAKHVIGEKNDYMILFDILANQKTYNENELRTKLPNTQFEKRLPAIKHYLYQAILSGMKAFHSKDDIDTIILGILQEAKVLYKKRLLEQSNELLLKAKKIVYQYQKLYFLPIIFSEQRELANHETFNRNLSALKEEELDILNKLADESKYAWLDKEFIKTIQDFGVFSAKSKMPFNINIKELDVNSVSTLNAKGPLLNIKALYFLLIEKDLLKAYEIYLDAHKVLNSNSYVVSEAPSRYIRMTGNLLTLQLILKKYTEFMSLFSELDKFGNNKLKKIDKISALTFFEIKNSTLLIYHIKTTQFNAAVQLSSIINKWLESNKQEVRTEAIADFYYYFSYLFFCLEDFEEAQVWLNKLLGEKIETDQIDLKLFTRLLSFLVYFELGNVIMIDSIIGSHIYYSKKDKTMWQFEKLLMQFMRRLSKVNSKKESIDIYRKTSIELKTINELLPEQLDLYFDLSVYLDCKVNNKSFKNSLIDAYSHL